MIKLTNLIENFYKKKYLYLPLKIWVLKIGAPPQLIDFWGPLKLGGPDN